MENNNWYTNEPKEYGSFYQPDGGKKRGGGKSVSLSVLIACMLVVAIISGSIGAGAAYLSSKRNGQIGTQQQTQGGSVVENPAQSGGTDVQSDAALEAQGGGTHVSDGLSVNTNNKGDLSAQTDIIKNSMASIVGITTEATINYYGKPTSSELGSGSGVIITQDGYIVTNNHVISGAENIKVCLQDGTEFPAKLIGTDTRTDIAVIKIEANNLPYAVMGSSGAMIVGEPVYAIGNPLGVFASSVSSGIISGLDRTLTIDGIDMTLMQTDAAVNPGNSGGGLFNTNGELIGIVNAKSSGLAVEGLGFAIPIDTARPIITDLMDLGYVSGRPYLGIQMQDITLRIPKEENGDNGGGGDYFGFFGFSNAYSYVNRVQVMLVEKGGPADQGGMLVNDIIVAFNGNEIQGYSQLLSQLYEYSAGDVVTISVLRGTQTVDLTITLSEKTN